MPWRNPLGFACTHMFALWANICSRNTERSEVLPKQISEAYLRPLASYEVTRLLAKSEAFRLTGTKAKLLCLIAKCEAFRVRNVMHHFVMLYVSRRRQPNSKQPTTRRVVMPQHSRSNCPARKVTTLRVVDATAQPPTKVQSSIAGS